MTRILLSISIITLFFFTSCEKDNDLTENEIYSILNEIIVTDSIDSYRVFYKFSDLYLKDEYKEGFTKKDVEFIYRQKSLFTEMTIKANILKQGYLKNARKGKSPYSDITQVVDGIIVQFSFPLISADRKLVLLEVKHIGNCNLCESGGKYLYKRINNRWQRIKTYDEWQS